MSRHRQFIMKSTMWVGSDQVTWPGWGGLAGCFTALYYLPLPAPYTALYYLPRPAPDTALHCIALH